MSIINQNNFQKCLDKDPNKRWSCERLLTHPYFEDYIVKEKEEVTTNIQETSSTANNRNREKSKISNTSLPQLPTEAQRVQQSKNTYARAEYSTNHLPTI
jgi:cyclin-dependent kinase-like